MFLFVLFNAFGLEFYIDNNAGTPTFYMCVCVCVLSVQFSSVAQLCLTLYNPMDCSTPGFPVLHHLPEFAQTHIGDAIQPSCPLSSPSPPAYNLSYHQGAFA